MTSSLRLSASRLSLFLSLSLSLSFSLISLGGRAFVVFVAVSFCVPSCLLCCVVCCFVRVWFGVLLFDLVRFGCLVCFVLFCCVCLVLFCFVMSCLFVCCVREVCVALLLGLCFCYDVCVPTKGSRPAGCMFRARPLQDAARGVCWLENLAHR